MKLYRLKVEGEIRPMGPVTYSIYWDQDAVNSWWEKEANMFGIINRMYESQMNDYMEAQLFPKNMHHALLRSINISRHKLMIPCLI